MADVIVLVAKDDPDQAPKLYACPKCGQCHSPKIYACREERAHEAARQAATDCYNCREHNTCEGCGEQCPKGWVRCDSCQRALVFEKAEKVPASGVEHCFGYDGEFYQSIEDAEDAGEPWVFASTFHPFRLDPDSILENCLDDHHEEVSSDDLNGVAELVAAIKAFNEKQNSGSYFEDRKRIVVLAGSGASA